MKTAIITGGGGFQGLPVLRSLHAIGWSVVIADSVMESLNRFETDNFHKVAETQCFEVFRHELLHLVRQYSALAVFPTTMYDLLVLARLRPELELLGVQVFVSSVDLVILLSDKIKAMIAAEAAGLPVLPSEDPAQHDFSYPLLGKPAQGWGNIGLIQVLSLKQWCEIVQKRSTETYLWQRKLENFTEWSVDFAIKTNTDCSPMVCRRRVRTTGGFAVVSELDAFPAVECLAAQVAAWLKEEGGCGLFNIQFLEEPDGSIWLSDINPRPGTSSVCALVAGLNLVEFLLSDRLLPQRAKAGLVVRSLHERFLPKQTQSIRGVVFDLDETLICQKSWMRAKLELILPYCQNLFEAASLALFRAEVLRLIDEGPWHQLIDIALARASLPKTLAKLLIAKWREVHPETIILHQDARALVRKLLMQGIPVALLSDNPAASQRQKIARLPQDIHFGSVVFTEELSAPKPDVKGFVTVAENMSILPENLMMIGDSPWRDGLGASRAG